MRTKERNILELSMLTIFTLSVWVAAELDWGIGIGIWVGGILAIGLLVVYDIIWNWPSE